MSDLPIMGSADKPVQLDPWQTIIEVGWGSAAAVIVEVTAVEIKFYDVLVLDPEEWFDNFFSGSTIVEDDYKEEFVLQMGTYGFEGTVVVEDEIHPWAWDGFFTGTIGDDAFNASQVAAGTTMFGYSPPIHLVGQQVERTQLFPPFGAYQLGDSVSHTHPNGSSVRYRSGYTPITHGPVGDPPLGDEDFSHTESWYWYRETTRPERTAAILRKSFLVNMRSGFARLAALQDYATMLEHSLDWSIRGFPANTSFNIADGRMTPIDGVIPKFEASGSVPGPHAGEIRRFSANGFVTS
jgi:hypothetical protein